MIEWRELERHIIEIARSEGYLLVAPPNGDTYLQVMPKDLPSEINLSEFARSLADRLNARSQTVRT
jgi:hypothetical protein